MQVFHSSFRPFSATPVLLVALAFSLARPCSADTYLFEETIETAVPEVSETAAPAAAQKPNKPLEKNGAGARPASPLKSGRYKWQAAEKSTLQVKTGTNAMEVVRKNDTTIYDFPKREIYTIENGKHQYESRSLFAMVAYRNDELINRFMLGKLMRVAKFKKLSDGETPFDKFYSEAMLGVSNPSYSSNYKAALRKLADRDIYEYNGQTVTAVKDSTTALSGEQALQFNRFLANTTMIHPAIRRQLGSRGKVPQELSWYVENTPLSKNRVTLKLIKYSPDNYKISLADLSEESSNSRLLSPLYLKLKERGYKRPADSQETSVSKFKQFVQKKNYLDALLTLTEYGLETGEHQIYLLQSISKQMQADADSQKLAKGCRAPENEEEARASLAALDSIDRKKYEKAYLIDIFRANLIKDLAAHGAQKINTTGEKKPELAFVSALKVNPFITGAYYDLGDYLRTLFKHSEAWECFKIARKLKPGHPFQKTLDETEEKLVRDNPAFFTGAN